MRARLAIAALTAAAGFATVGAVHLARLAGLHPAIALTAVLACVAACAWRAGGRHHT